MQNQTNSGYRAQYRDEFISARYQGRLHLLFTVALSLTVIGLCIWSLEEVKGLQWLAIPATFLYANFAEWAGHRFAMHRPVPGLGLVYKRHSLQHHRFFTEHHMEIDSERDYKAVLFPPVLVTFFLIAFFLPFGLAIAFLFGTNVSALCIATGMGYFLNYELLHFSYHLPNGHWVHRVPGFKTLMQLHQSHHNPKLMAHKNFNITYPITDWLMGTWARSDETALNASRKSTPNTE